MKLSTRECQHLLDALIEYEEIIVPKELEDNEIGMNAERLDKCKQRLTNFISMRLEYNPNASLDATTMLLVVLDISSGTQYTMFDVPKMETTEDIESYIVDSLDVRLADINWQEVTNHVYHHCNK